MLNKNYDIQTESVGTDFRNFRVDGQEASVTLQKSRLSNLNSSMKTLLQLFKLAWNQVGLGRSLKNGQFQPTKNDILRIYTKFSWKSILETYDTTKCLALVQQKYVKLLKS